MYKDLKIWQESIVLIKDVYKLASILPKSEEYNLKQQLKRAVVSVALNIAEGKSRKTEKDFANFLVISVASLAEVDAIFRICNELNFINELELKETFSQIDKLGKMINAFRNKLNSYISKLQSN